MEALFGHFHFFENNLRSKQIKKKNNSLDAHFPTGIYILYFTSNFFHYNIGQLPQNLDLLSLVLFLFLLLCLLGPRVWVGVPEN